LSDRRAQEGTENSGVDCIDTVAPGSWGGTADWGHWPPKQPT